MNHITIPKKTADENARQYAYWVLYDKIMKLDFPPGMLLVDAELSDALGVSRTPIREAIVSLKEAKLVDVHPQKSSSVSKIDLIAVEEGVFCRSQVESGILREAIEKMDGTYLPKLHQNIEGQRKALENGQRDDFNELDNSFHKILYLSVNKSWTWSTVMRIVTHQDRVRQLQARLGEDRLEPAFRDHEEIFTMITARGGRDVSAFLHNHLTAGYRSALPELIRRYPEYFTL